MIDLGLVVARFLHYAAVTTLFGMSFFPLYAYRNAEPIALLRWRRRVLLASAIAALLSGVLWFVFSTANMTGTWADVADPEVVWTIVHDTRFGRMWAARLALSIILTGLLWTRVVSEFGPGRDLITPALAALLLISLAGVGHAQIEQGVEGIIHIISDAAHLLAAGAWLGGLLPLGYILLPWGRNNAAAEGSYLSEILLRFSGMGYVAVATIAGSGFVNGWFLIGNIPALLATPYGQLLIAKLVLFAGMLVLAVSNRFWIVPRLANGPTDDRNGLTAWTARLRHHVLGEQFLGLMVLLIVSVLGIMQPAIGQ